MPEERHLEKVGATELSKSLRLGEGQGLPKEDSDLFTQQDSDGTGTTSHSSESPGWKRLKSFGPTSSLRVCAYTLAGTRSLPSYVAAY